MHRVVVVGSGLAGLFAALQAKKLGAKVDLVVGRAGATSLGSGAWDGEPDDRPGVDDDVRALLADAPVALGDAEVVTAAGVVRSCRARFEQVLAVDRSAQIVVPRLQLAGWDSEAIAVAVDEEVRASGGHARAVEASLIDDPAILRSSLAELALRLDAPEALERFAERVRALRGAVGDDAHILFPPILGVDARVVRRLREVGGARLGEALAEPGGVVVHRMRAWSRDALATAGVDVHEGEARRVAEGGVTLEGGQVLGADRVVLAVGGLITAGLVYRAAEHEDGTSSVAPVRLGLVVEHQPPIAPVLDGQPIDPPGSMYGVDADHWFAGDAPAIARAGLPVDDDGVVLDREGRSVGWLLAVGDVVAARPRTLLEAASSGVRAGRRAAS